MSFNFNNINSNNTENYPNRQYVPPSIPANDIEIMQGQKVLTADRDEISNKMSDMRLKSYNNQSNYYFQPFRPDLINIESNLNRNHIGKRTEFKDTINNRLSNNTQIFQGLPQNQPQNLLDNNQPIQQQDNRISSSSNYHTNKFNNRDKNNDRLNNFTSLSTNSHINAINQNRRIGYSSNDFVDENGNPKYINNQTNQTNQTNQNNTSNNSHFVHSCTKKPNYISEEQYTFTNQNVMTIGRLPESNQSSRINFKDKANQRLQDLISLPKTCSLPVVPVYQHKDLWKHDLQNSQNMKTRINELNPNCQVVVNDMIPINTQLSDY